MGKDEFRVEVGLPELNRFIGKYFDELELIEGRRVVGDHKVQAMGVAVIDAINCYIETKQTKVENKNETHLHFHLTSDHVLKAVNGVVSVELVAKFNSDGEHKV